MTAAGNTSPITTNNQCGAAITIQFEAGNPLPVPSVPLSTHENPNTPTA
jgi:hypothetical protein